MNQDQINITSMHSTTANYMDQNNSIWGDNVAMAATVAQLKSNNDTIAQKRDTQETAVDGVSAQALQAKHGLEEKIIEIADQIYALAARTNNVMLETQSHVTASGLDGLDPEKLQEKGRDIAGLATANLAGLADYGITAADVTALSNAVNAFTPFKTAFQTAVAKRVGQTKTLPQAIADNQSLLTKQLDKQMTKFKKSQPEFYTGYLAARTIFDRRSHHMSKQPATGTTTLAAQPA